MRSTTTAPAVAVALAVLCAPAFAPSPASADPPLTEQLRAIDAQIAASPGAFEPLLRRADLFIEYDRFEDALADLTQLSVYAPNDPRIALRRAEALVALRRPGEALAVLDVLLARSSGTPRAYRMRGDLRADQGDLRGAADDYAAGLQLGDDVELYRRHSRTLRELGDRAGAVRTLRVGVQAMDGAVVLREALVEALIEAGRGAEALTEIEAAMRNARVRTGWLLHRGDALEALGRHAEARREREAALAEAERLLGRRASPHALYMRARALFALGRYAEAEAELGRVIRSAPRMGEAVSLLSRVRREASR